MNTLAPSFLNQSSSFLQVIIIIIVIRTLFKEEAQLGVHPIFPGVLI